MPRHIFFVQKTDCTENALPEAYCTRNTPRRDFTKHEILCTKNHGTKTLLCKKSYSAKKALKSQHRISVNAKSRSTLGLFEPLSTLQNVAVVIGTPSNCSFATISAFLRFRCNLNFLMFVPTRLLVLWLMRSCLILRSLTKIFEICCQNGSVCDKITWYNY